MFNIALIHPQIPQNTGAIARLCVNAGMTLHIVKPIIFDIDEKSVRRAGLDYWKYLKLKIYDSEDEFFNANSIFIPKFYFATTKTTNLYYDVKYSVDDFLIFGSESHGLPERFMSLNPKNHITIPMTNEGRSLNLAMAVGIISYEAIRQNINFFSLRDKK